MKTIIILTLTLASTAFSQLGGGGVGLSHHVPIVLSPFVDDFTTTASYRWGSLSVTNGKAVITPTLGDELLINGTFEEDTASWAVTSGGTLTTDANRLKITDDADGYSGATQALSATVNEWVRLSADYTKVVLGGYLGLATNAAGAGGHSLVTRNSNGALLTINRPTTATNFVIVFLDDGGLNQVGYFDNISAKKITLSSAIKSVDVGKSDVTVTANAILAAATQAGIVVNLDNQTTPANFVVAYHDGTNAHLEKCVAGVYTSLINTAATYVASAPIKVIKASTTYQLWYNNAQVSTDKTVSDAGIISNTRHGIFATSNADSLDNFIVVQ